MGKRASHWAGLGGTPKVPPAAPYPGQVLHSGHSDTHRPIVVHMAELVCQPLDVVRLQATAVIDDIVVCWGHAPASHCLAHDEKVIPRKAGRARQG